MKLTIGAVCHCPKRFFELEVISRVLRQPRQGSSNCKNSPSPPPDFLKASSQSLGALAHLLLLAQTTLVWSHNFWA